jgi:preprotein translocase subunit Sec61beta
MDPKLAGGRSGILAQVDPSMAIHAAIVVVVVLVLYHILFHN